MRSFLKSILRTADEPPVPRWFWVAGGAMIAGLQVFARWLAVQP